MDLGNAPYNGLLNLSEKHYEISDNSINLDDMNNSYSQIVNCIDKNSVVLDVGCSYGYIGKWLKKNKDCKMYGIEIDDVELMAAKKSGYYEDVYKINLNDMQSDDSETQKFLLLNIYFDFIICADVLEHLGSPHEILNQLGEKLKKNGKFIVSIPNISYIDILMGMINGEFNYSDYGILDNTHIKFFTKKSFVEWIYSCNEYFKKFKLDAIHKASVTVETELSIKFKQDYRELYNLLLDSNEELKVLQNIFILTKINKDEECSEIEDFIKEYRYNIKEVFNDDDGKKPSLPLDKNLEINYEFIAYSNNIKSIGIFVGTYYKVVDANLNLSFYIKEEKEAFFSEKFTIENIEDNSWVNLKISSNRELKGKNLILKITGNLENYDKMSIWLNKDDEPIIRIDYYDEFDYWNSDEKYPYLKKINDKLVKLINKNKLYAKIIENFQEGQK